MYCENRKISIDLSPIFCENTNRMTQDIESQLRSRVAKAREAAGLAQAEIERSLGLPPGAVSKIEGGSRGITSAELAQVARLTGRHVGWFFDESPQPTPAMRGEAGSEAGRADIAWLCEFADAYCFLKQRLQQKHTENKREI
jgi:transcriptional regulator with XRE-family HTH domain